MAFNLIRDEGNSASGTEWRFNPPDIRKTIWAESLLTFFQKSFTTGALRGEQELEEGQRKFHGSSQNWSLCACLLSARGRRGGQDDGMEMQKITMGSEPLQEENKAPKKSPVRLP